MSTIKQQTHGGKNMKEKRLFGMVSINSLCNDYTKPTVSIPILENNKSVCYVMYEVCPYDCTIAGYQPVKLISPSEEFKDIDVPDGILNVSIGENEKIQVQFSWVKDEDEEMGEYETDMLEIHYLF